MRKNEIIRRAMGLTAVAYNNIKHSYFTEWCEQLAIELALPSRMLMIDAQLYDWFCDQWKRNVELPFYTENQDWLEANLDGYETYRYLFTDYTSNVFKSWPNPILKRIQTQFKNSFNEA